MLGVLSRNRRSSSIHAFFYGIGEADSGWTDRIDARRNLLETGTSQWFLTKAQDSSGKQGSPLLHEFQKLDFSSRWYKVQARNLTNGIENQSRCSEVQLSPGGIDYTSKIHAYFSEGSSSVCRYHWREPIWPKLRCASLVLEVRWSQWHCVWVGWWM